MSEQCNEKLNERPLLEEENSPLEANGASSTSASSPLEGYYNELQKSIGALAEYISYYQDTKERLKSENQEGQSEQELNGRFVGFLGRTFKSIETILDQISKIRQSSAFYKATYISLVALTEDLTQKIKDILGENPALLANDHSLDSLYETIKQKMRPAELILSPRRKSTLAATSQSLSSAIEQSSESGNSQPDSRASNKPTISRRSSWSSPVHHNLRPVERPTLALLETMQAVLKPNPEEILFNLPIGEFEERVKIAQGMLNKMLGLIGVRAHDATSKEDIERARLIYEHAQWLHKAAANALNAKKEYKAMSTAGDGSEHLARVKNFRQESNEQLEKTKGTAKGEDKNSATGENAIPAIILNNSIKIMQECFACVSTHYMFMEPKVALTSTKQNASSASSFGLGARPFGNNPPPFGASPFGGNHTPTLFGPNPFGTPPLCQDSCRLYS